jgi:YHS domain-containing protein
MPLEEGHAKESLVYAGQTYYFCSVGCRAEFERHTQDYTQSAESQDGVKNDV